MNPETAAWLPLHTSCGAFTGLPCIFCGTTRAIHHLLNGRFAEAVYFNWLAFPVAAFAFALAVISLLEALLARKVIRLETSFTLTGRSASLGFCALLALWVLQVSLAISLHKHELLNPSGPLYPFFVRSY